VPEFDQMLPKILSDSGYDVWMTNNRGNAISFEHEQSDIYSAFNPFSEYWDFSFDEMAKYDVKANINYILRVTKKQKLSWIGHSQGTL